MSIGIYRSVNEGVQIIIDSMIIEIENFNSISLNKYLKFADGECNILKYSGGNTSTVSIKRHSNAIDFTVRFMDGNHYSHSMSYSCEDVEEFCEKLREFVEIERI